MAALARAGAAGALVAVLVAAPTSRAGSATAGAAPVCGGARRPQVVLTGQGTVESIAFDRAGRLLFGDLDRAAVFRLDGPGATPVRVLSGAAAGLTVGRQGTLLAGVNSSRLNSEVDPAVDGALADAGAEGPGKVLRFDPATGRSTVAATGLSMVNGVVEGVDGSLYVSNHESAFIERVAPDGRVDPRWAAAPSANGLALDATGRYLYATLMLTPGLVVRIDVRDPADVVLVHGPDASDPAVGFDGVRVDPRGELVVAAHGSGEVWRISSGGTSCVLASGLGSLPGLGGPADVAIAPPGPFGSGNLYVVTWSGSVVEIPEGGR